MSSKISLAPVLLNIPYCILSFRDLLEKELESVGIRLNRFKPNIYFKVRERRVNV